MKQALSWLAASLALLTLAGCVPTTPSAPTPTEGVDPAVASTASTVSTSAIASAQPAEPTVTQPASGRVLAVPFLQQYPEFPTGCESVSAVMLLRYAGVNVTVDRFIDDFLPQGLSPYGGEDGDLWGGDPREEFLGDPRDEDGWGCFAPAIETALEELIRTLPAAAGLRATALAGVSLQRLCADYIDRDIPVEIWVTPSMVASEPGKTWRLDTTGELFSGWVKPMHVLVLVGYDESYYYCNDPLKAAYYRYSKAAVERAYEALGRQAVVVEGRG